MRSRVAGEPVSPDADVGVPSVVGGCAAFGTRMRERHGDQGACDEERKEEAQEHKSLVDASCR